jgi:hypothetical protein
MTMKKLASKLPIQQMIANVISNATEKVAAEEKNKKVKELIAYEKAEHGGHLPSVAEEEQEKKASANVQDDYIEKLASAVEFIAGNFESIEFPHKGVLQKAAEHVSTLDGGSPQGAGKGPGALEVSQAIGGKQNYTLGHAHDIEASKSQAHAPLSGAHEADGKTQLENNMHHAPGGGSLAPTAKYPPKGPLVAGPTKTATVQELYQSAIANKNGATKTASKSPLRTAVLAKLAGEDVMKANIEAPATANPLAGMGELESFDASKPSPHQAGDHGGGFGNQARHLISSNQAAIDATKRDAKGPVKTQLSEVLEEPALNRGTDPVLNENLRNTGEAGVKIAAARAALEKVAQQGCTCKTIDGGCAYCNLQKAAAATKSNRESTKLANAMMGYGGGSNSAMSGAGMSAGSHMGGGAGAMSSMAETGAGADGCTCGHTGDCRVCKLKAALAAAMAEGGQMAPGMQHGQPAGSPVEKDSTGAGLSGGTY